MSKDENKPELTKSVGSLKTRLSLLPNKKRKNDENGTSDNKRTTEWDN